MTSLVIVIRQLMFFPIQLLAAVLVFSLPLEKRSHFPQRLLGFTAVLLAAIVGAQYVVFLFLPAEVFGSFDDMARQSAPGTLIWCCILFALMVLLLWFTHALSVREAVYCASCAYLMELSTPI